MLIHAPVLEIDYRGYRGRGTNEKVLKVRIYVIFAISAFCSRGTKVDF